MSIAHFIFTRSNYHIGGPAQLWTDARIDEQYLRYRLDLFKRFCAPSIRAQTRQDFQWIIRWNPECPLAEEWAAATADLPVILVGGEKQDDASDTASTPDDCWRRAILPHLDGATHVMTTRVDDDDALAPDHVARLRAAVRETGRPVAYTFPVGYCLRLHSRGSTFTNWIKRENQFCSLLSPVEPLALVTDRTHGRVGELGPWQTVDRKPGHLWTRHPRSKSNGGRFRARRPVAELVKVWPFLGHIK